METRSSSISMCEDGYDQINFVLPSGLRAGYHNVSITAADQTGIGGTIMVL